MKLQANLDAIHVPKTHTAAANTNSVIDLAKADGTRHVLDYIWGGYNTAPSTGQLTVFSTVNNTNVTMTVPITAGGPFFLPMYGLQGDNNTNIIVTLVRGGANVVGSVNALTR